MRDCIFMKSLSSTAGFELRAFEERMAAEEGGVTPTEAPTAENAGNKLQEGIFACLPVVCLVLFL